MKFFPYEYRPYQKEFADAVASAASSAVPLVVESGTGTGKTVCALSGSLTAAETLGKKVLYLTRTNSQQQQVMAELRKINEITPVFGVAVQGRRNCCPLIQNDPDLRSGNPEELSKLCSEKKARSAEGKKGGCRYFSNIADTEEIKNFCRAAMPSAEEFTQYCASKEVCPYELTKLMLPEAQVVAAPYVYFFIPFIRNRLLEWMKVTEEDLILIIDEAHNIPEYAREIASFKLSQKALNSARSELTDYGDPEVIPGVSVMDVIDAAEQQLEEACREYIIEDDGLVPSDFLEEGLMSAFSATSHAIEAAAENIWEFGETIREAKMKKGRLPRSYIGSFGAFLQNWMQTWEEYYVKLVTGGENPAFEAYCMDPSVACRPVLDCYSSLHMSGTLSPVNEYKASTGMPPETKSLIFKSPFDPGRRKIFYVPDVTTKYEEIRNDEEIIPRMEDYTVSVCNACGRSAAVFFPSYSLMEQFISDKVPLRLKSKLFMEKRGMEQNQLMAEVKAFKESRKGVFFAVMGGRVSEGIDFPGDELEIAVLAGIPYPKPTARHRALMHYYEVKFGMGWQYTVKAPVTRRMLQTLGRLIRTERDAGAALILDSRAPQFSQYFSAEVSEAPANDIINFFRGLENNQPGL